MFIAVRTGLEPATPCVTGMYSNQAELFFLAILGGFARLPCHRCFSIASAKVVRVCGLCKFFGHFFEKKVCRG